MTTEPKDPLGGDEPLEANAPDKCEKRAGFCERCGYRACMAAPKASDPPPVREAVAWRKRLSRVEGHYTYSNVNMTGDWEPLYADPLPVSREAVARIIEPLVLGLATEMTYAQRRAFADKKIDAILALTGETSRDTD